MIGLIDTSVLVDYLRGLKESRHLMEQVRTGELEAHISVLTEAELFAGKECEKSSKREEIRALVAAFRKHDLSNEIAQKAGEFKRKYGISLDDCIIASTAFSLNTPVLTKNVEEFRAIKEIEVKEPY